VPAAELSWAAVCRNRHDAHDYDGVGASLCRNHVICQILQTLQGFSRRLRRTGSTLIVSSCRASSQQRLSYSQLDACHGLFGKIHLIWLAADTGGIHATNAGLNGVRCH
jgi:hypothetical protein